MTDNTISRIDHIVVLMLENLSFDHMLGFLYTESGNLSPSGQAFDGLTGEESNPDPAGQPVKVFRIGPATPNAYFMPGADPGEGYTAANSQLFGAITPPSAEPAVSNQGFVTDFAYTLGWQARSKGGRKILPGTTAADIMGCFGPDMLPILSGLARGYAVCDRWFGSVPTETLPNRAFACAATSQGHLKDSDTPYTAPTIFGALTAAAVSWSIFGYDGPPLARNDFPDIESAPDSHFGKSTDFQAAAQAGSLAAYTFLEPGWSGPDQNDQHPVSDLARGEQLIHDVYYALRNGPAWEKTLLIITYDEHGGCYDHVPPPWTATPPDASPGEMGFAFNRFGPRVPTVLVSPLIAAGTVFRAPAGNPPHDHTTILKTVETRFGVAPLTARDRAASDLGPVLTLPAARTDDPLAGVSAPPPAATAPGAGAITHLQRIQAGLVSGLPVADGAGGGHHEPPPLDTRETCQAYIVERLARWTGHRS